MLKFRNTSLIFILLGILVLSACQPQAPTPSPEEIQQAVEQTIAALPTATADPTAAEST